MPGNDQINESFLRYREFQFMSKMMHDQPSAAVPASRDRRNFLIAGAGLALAATTLGRSGAVMAKPAGQDTPNAPSDAAPVRKETLTTRKLGSLEVQHGTRVPADGGLLRRRSARS